MKQNWIRFVALFLALTMVLVSGIITTTSSFHASEEGQSSGTPGEEVEIATIPEPVVIDEELQKAAEESVPIEEAVNKDDNKAQDKAENEKKSEEADKEKKSDEDKLKEEEAKKEEEKTVITFTASEGGTVSVEKQELLSAETPVAVEAVAVEGYKFVNWTKQGTEVSTEAAFTPENVAADYVANFEAQDKFPAQDFSAVVAGTQINAHAPEGSFPDGTTMNAVEVVSQKVVEAVDEVTEYEVEQENVLAFDITFTDKKGVEIEPLIPIELFFSNVNIEADTLEVFHLDDVNSNAESVSQLESNNGEVSVDAAAEFSLYVIAGGRSYAPQSMYHYALIPGKDMDDYSVSVDDTWFGVGVSTVEGLKPASEYLAPGKFGRLSADLQYKKIAEPVPLYPNLSFGGKTYKYAVPGSGNETREGYYNLKIARLVKASGANAGNNRYNSTAQSGVPTFHLDYTIIFNNVDSFVYTFNVKDPGEMGFNTIDGYAKTVNKGYSESRINRPVMNDKSYQGQMWRFDGWYKDENFSIKADFKGTITANTHYYGRYVPSKADYVVKHWQQKLDGGKEENSANYEVKDTETFSAQIGQSVSPSVKSYAGFNSPKVKAVKINASGTEINYYYTRKEYTVTYDLKGGKLTKAAGDNYTENSDGTVSYKVRHGAATPVPRNTPEKSATGSNQVFVFTGWSPKAETAVTRDIRYSAEYAIGELVVEGQNGVYNGQSYSVNIVKNNNIENIQYSDGKGSWSNTAPKYVDAGTYPVSVKGNIKGTSKSVVCETKVIVGKKDVTVTANSLSRDYNGKAITVDEVAAANSGKAYTNTEIVSGEILTADITVTPNVDGADLSSGSSIVGKVTIKNGSRDVSQNYNIKKANGTITINNDSKSFTLTVKPKSATVTYNGKEQKVEGYSFKVVDNKGNKELTGYKVENITAAAKGTNAGSYDVVFTGADKLAIKDPKGKDVTKYFSVVYEKGSLKINPLNLKIKGVDKSKAYDGTALVGAMEAKGLIEGHSISNATFSTQEGWRFWSKDTGIKYPAITSRGTLGYTPEKDSIVIVSGGDVVTGNYSITTGKGTLEITKPSSGFDLTITANGGTYTYDGKEKFAEVIGGNQYTVAGLNATDRLEGVVVEGSATNVGDTGKTFVKKRLLAPDVHIVNIETGEDVTNCYNVKSVDGKITINKRSLTLKANGGVKVYDGTALTPSVDGAGKAFTIADEANNLVSGHIVSADVEGSQTKAGKSASKIKNVSIKAGGSGRDLSGNYDITLNDGELVVNRKEVEIKASSAAKKYDGTALTKNEVSYDGNPSSAESGDIKVKLIGEDEITVKVEGSQTLVGKSENKVTLVKGDDNYDVKLANGELQVKDVPVNPGDDEVKGVVEKSADSSKAYRAGDTVTFDITVKNIYDSEVDVVLTEKEGFVLSNLPADAVISGNTATFKLAREASVKATATKVLTEADLSKNAADGTGKFSNHVTVKMTPVGDVGSTGKDYEDSKEVPTFVPHSNLSVKKTSNVASGSEVKLGDTITYTITVTNNGNEDLKNVVVKDPLTKLNETISSLAIGESKEFSTKYKVTVEDVQKGKVVNHATASGNTEHNPDKPVDGKDETETAVEQTEYKITYFLNGGEVAENANPDTYKATTPSFTLNNPTKVGYDFEGWSGTEVKDKSKSVTVKNGSTGDREYTAHWTPAKGTKYQINHYQANLEDNGYTLESTVDSTGTTEEELTIASFKKSYNGFTYEGGVETNAPSDVKPASFMEKAVVKADGSLVINMYYSRNTYTITYDLRGGSLEQGSDTYVAGSKEGTVEFVKVPFGAKTPIPSNKPEKTAKGDDKNVYVFTNWDPSIAETVTGNTTYRAIYAFGNLEVKGWEGPYDGNSHTVTTDGSNGVDSPQYSEDGGNTWKNTPPEYTDSGEYTVTVKAKIPGTDTEITKTVVIKIAKKELTITANSFSRDYNGKSISADELVDTATGLAYTSTELAGGDVYKSVEVVAEDGVDGVEKSAGNSTIGNVVIEKSGKDVTKNYEIRKVPGTISVIDNSKPYTITITGKSGSGTYNGKEQSVSGYDFKVVDKDGNKVSGYTVENVEAVAKGTNAGDYKTEFNAGGLVIRDSKGKDVTKYFNPGFVEGNLKVDPKEVTIVALDKEKVYNGTALEGDFSADTLVAGHKVSSVSFTTKEGWLQFWTKEMGIKLPSIVAPGTLVYVAENTDENPVKIVDAYGQSVEKNYTIKTKAGTLKVTKPGGSGDELKLTVTANSGSFLYDAKAHTAPANSDSDNRQYTVSGLLPTDEIRGASVTGSATNVSDEGKTELKTNLLGKPEFKVVNTTTNEDVTDCYNISLVAGKVSIIPRSLSLLANSGSKVYDGKELTPEVGADNKQFTVEAEGDGLVSGHSVEASVSGSQTEAGVSSSSVSDAVIKADGKGSDLSGNYSINYKSGKLEVTKKDITLEAASAVKMYDGKPLTYNVVKFGDKKYSAPAGENIVVTTPEGDSIVVSVTGSQTLVGKSENTIAIVSGDGNYNIDAVNGFLRVKDTSVKPDDPGDHVDPGDPNDPGNGGNPGGGNNPENPGGKDVPDGVIIKKAENANIAYRAGDTVEFNIALKNIYDSDVTVVLTEKEGIVFSNLPADAVVTGSQATFSMAKGSELIIRASHVLTQADLDGNDPITGAGVYVNNARVSFTPADPKIETDHPEFNDDDEVPTFVPHPGLAVRKVSNVEAGAKVKLGDSITYTITATNNGNVDLKNVVVEDKLTGDKWTVDNLAMGQSESFSTVYKVTVKDVEAGSVVNTATASGNTDDGGNIPASGEDTTEVAVDKSFKLTIHYVDEAGNTLASDYTETVAYGSASSLVYSPAIAGMSPSFDYVQISSMPAQDVEVSVIYRAAANPANPTAPDFGTPQVAGSATVPAANLNGADIVVDNNGNVQLVPVEDVETALANGLLEGELWNILYFLILLVTIVVLYNYFVSAKKHQKRIYELRSQLKDKDPFK